jgi:hypothetical protein
MLAQTVLVQYTHKITFLDVRIENKKTSFNFVVFWSSFSNSEWIYSPTQKSRDLSLYDHLKLITNVVILMHFFYLTQWRIFFQTYNTSVLGKPKYHCHVHNSPLNCGRLIKLAQLHFIFLINIVMPYVHAYGLKLSFQNRFWNVKCMLSLYATCHAHFTLLHLNNVVMFVI